jgi:2-polyprenyl-3-methyl-5-hydroxy-6-metoxy-1,4-benzoquinol methylase
MEIKRGKKLDSYALKRDLDKSESISKARAASLAIVPGDLNAKCGVCGSKNAKFQAEIYGFQYYQCEGCDSAYVANAPSFEEIKKLYSSDYYSDANKVLLANDNIIDYRLQNIAVPKIEYVIENLTTDRKRWLDIGCGVGENIKVVQDKGWEVVGVETNESEREYGIGRFGVNIVDDFITEENVADYKGYGVISMFSILEHTMNPNLILKSIGSIQETCDNLIIEVPHFPSISVFSQMTFPDEVNRMLHPPLHLYLFSLKALEMMLSEQGYEITNVWYFGQDFYEMFSTFSLHSSKLNNSILHEKLSAMLDDFQEVIDKHELSDEIIVIGRKR